VFLLVPAHPGCPRQRAIKQSLSLFKNISEKVVLYSAVSGSEQLAVKVDSFENILTGWW